jgi:hypothetical protein
VPGKRSALIGGLDELLERAPCIGVAHVIQNGDTERTAISRALSSLEAQDFRLSGAVGGRNLVVVRCSGFKLVEADFVEELAALSNGLDFGARWRAVITIGILASIS